jgi:hypothetical protein
MSNEKNWRQECAKLHIELDKVRLECAEWKEKWERLMQFKEAPRLPLRGRSTLDCVGTDKGKASTQVYENFQWGTEKSYAAQKLTTVGWVEGDDLK